MLVECRLVPNISWKSEEAIFRCINVRIGQAFSVIDQEEGTVVSGKKRLPKWIWFRTLQALQFPDLMISIFNIFFPSSPILSSDSPFFLFFFSSISYFFKWIKFTAIKIHLCNNIHALSDSAENVMVGSFLPFLFSFVFHKGKTSYIEWLILRIFHFQDFT